MFNNHSALINASLEIKYEKSLLFCLFLVLFLHAKQLKVHYLHEKLLIAIPRGLSMCIENLE